MSMLGLWDPWYRAMWESGSQPRQHYGNTSTYRKGAAWLERCPLIEDWGCGLGWLRNYVAPEQYRGIDGTRSAHVDVIADLREYRSQVPGIFMRHVLEHNWDWRMVLDNLLASFTDRAALILFTPMAEATHAISGMTGCGGINVPAIAFRHEDLTARLPLGVRWRVEDIESPETWFGTERVYYLERVPRQDAGP